MCQLFGQTIVLQIAVVASAAATVVFLVVVVVRIIVVVYLAPQHGMANDTHNVAIVGWSVSEMKSSRI